MNNYTVVIKTQQAEVTPAQVKTAVEDLLIRALPPVTLRVGSTTQPDTQTILVAFESDGARDFLTQQLRALEKRFPVQLERIEWGNQAAAPGMGMDPAIDSLSAYPTQKILRSDPYAGTAPQSEPTHIYKASAWSNLRRVFSFLFLLAWLALVILFILYETTSGRGISSILDSTAATIAMQILLLASIFTGPLYPPWRIISRVVCDSEGIEVYYCLRQSAIRRTWAEIYRMNVNPLEITLFSGQKPVRFSSKQRSGFREEPAMIKTIIERAGLRFVSGSLVDYVFRRPDAPE